MFLYLFFTLLSSATVVDEAVAFSMDCAGVGVCGRWVIEGKLLKNVRRHTNCKMFPLTSNSSSKLALPWVCIFSTCFRKASKAPSFKTNLSLLLVAPVGRCTETMHYSVHMVRDSCNSTAQKDRVTEEKEQRPSSNSGPMLYRRVSAMRATDPSRDPLSPIIL